jgi:hypothetical protein
MTIGASRQRQQGNEAQKIQQGEYPMKHTVMLTVASMLSILLFTFHFADDIARGFEPGGFKNLRGVLTMVVWPYGTLVPAERRTGSL